MTIITDALRQAFMPKHEYDTLREEDKAWHRLQRPITISFLILIAIAVAISTVISLKIVFPGDYLNRPFCSDLKIQPVSVNSNFTAVPGATARDSDLFPRAFYLTDQETVDYYWMVVFIPSTVLFSVSVVYLIAGITVAYSAPSRHGCLKVVENNYCASRRGGVRCLAIINMSCAILYGLLALFLGSTLLTLGSSCSGALFWCYEISSWGLVVLYGSTAYFLRRKAGTIVDEIEFSGRNIGLEMLESGNPIEYSHDLERRVVGGFKSWMGPSFLSSDEDDDDDDDDEEETPFVTRTNSSRQRVTNDV